MMCWGCCDCMVVSSEPFTCICDGFRGVGTKKVVIDNGRLTPNYRWCSRWGEDKIHNTEKELVSRQRRYK